MISGFIILVKGADFLLDGATSLAKKLAISEIAIGLTVVAFGTSSPELIVNIISSIKGHPDICFGNVLGSNIFNILAVLGVAGLIHPITVLKNTVRLEIPFVLLGTILVLLLANNFGMSGHTLYRSDGAILVASLGLFMIYVLRMDRNPLTDGYNIVEYSTWKTVIYITLGITGLFLGGEMVVRNAVKIARLMQVSEKLIALTIVAFGTSLPEFVTSIIAVTRKRFDLAVGNVIGSNLFNLFMVLGVTAIINPIVYDPVMNIDVYLSIIITVILLITMFTGRRRQLDRYEALLFILMYIAYIVYIINRK